MWCNPNTSIRNGPESERGGLLEVPRFYRLRAPSLSTSPSEQDICGISDDSVATHDERPASSERLLSPDIASPATVQSRGPRSRLLRVSRSLRRARPSLRLPRILRRRSKHTMDNNYDYIYTLMYGQYSKELGDFAKSESKRLRELEKKRKREERLRRQELLPYRGKWNRRVLKVLGYFWKHTFARIGEDWVFLAILGVLMACISFVMDYGIAICNKGE
ncbi:Chloride channel protein 2 [Amphibalanus amphitrite]|uniref:Chloride channel protein 2 n=1 Tax=Amphibalanus amphitrite TaxID=1232801 RepID=A0A6A4WYK7_AMPAM|nr:Chloride channel protein 2 [Amphibalanus amphitrite]